MREANIEGRKTRGRKATRREEEGSIRKPKNSEAGKKDKNDTDLTLPGLIMWGTEGGGGGLPDTSLLFFISFFPSFLPLLLIFSFYSLSSIFLFPLITYVEICILFFFYFLYFLCFIIPSSTDPTHS